MFVGGGRVDHEIDRAGMVASSLFFFSVSHLPPRFMIYRSD